MDENVTADRTPSRGLRRALYVSVAVNLLVVGAVVGLLAAHGLREGYPHGDRGVGFGRYTQALSPQDRAALRDAYQGQMHDMMRQGAGGAEYDDPRALFHAERAGIVAALRADPFDPAAVQALFDRQKMRMTAAIALGQSLLLQRISAMSPQERAVFADRVEAGPQKDTRHGRDRQRDGR
ncbi:MAG: periplasmic heavy metal sensor [Rhodobacteraceae bacterium]|nr:periplasmic heavy metal sensor [Paracoccaceae bacterium]